MLGDRRFLALCAIALLPLYGFGQIYITLPVLLRDSVGVSAAQWGLLAALYAAAGVLLQYPIVRRTRGFDKLAVLSLASAYPGVGLAGAAFAPKGIATAACILLVSAGSMLLVPIAPALVSQMAPPELRGRYMGTWTLVWMTGAALAPIFGGLALDRLGRGAYLVILAVCLLGALPLLCCEARRRVWAVAQERTGEDFGKGPPEALRKTCRLSDALCAACLEPSSASCRRHGPVRRLSAAHKFGSRGPGALGPAAAGGRGPPTNELAEGDDEREGGSR